MAIDEEPEHLELSAVRVLVLVDEDVEELLLPAVADVRALLPEASHLADEIVEVERAEALERALVLRIDDLRHLVVVVALALGVLLGRLERVLRVRDARDDLRGVELLAGVRAAQDLLHRGEAVALVEDRERSAERLALAPEHHEPERVEGGDDEALAAVLAAEATVLHEVSHALGHLAGGLVREGERADHVRGDAALHQASDAVRDDARLAGAGAGQNEHRAVLVLDRLLLGGVHSGSCGRHGVARASQPRRPRGEKIDSPARGRFPGAPVRGAGILARACVHSAPPVLEPRSSLRSSWHPCSRLPRAEALRRSHPWCRSPSRPSWRPSPRPT